jgi:beta-phosphoglucomutase-like phosphatase (HAD superfamily)
MAAVDRINLDGLIAPWWLALEAAESALRTSDLDSRARAEQSARLERQRHEMSQLLRVVAHDQHARSPLLGWLEVHRITPGMLGLANEVRACVFDLDGVLTTSAAVQVAVWRELFDAFLLGWAGRGSFQFAPFDPHHDYLDHVAGRPRLTGIREFLASRGVHLPEGAPNDPPDADTVHGLAARKNLLLQRHLDREGVAAFAGSRCYLQAARMLGLRRAVVSESANTQEILTRAGLARLVEERIDAPVMEAEGLQAKPEPDCVQCAAVRLGVRPDQVAVFATGTSGVAAARAAGARLAILVDREHQGAAPGSEPDLVIRDLAELLSRAPAA